MLNLNDLAANVLEAWGDRIPETMGALISRCKFTYTTMADLIRANSRNDTGTRAKVERKLSLLDIAWDLYNITCIQEKLADYDDMVIQVSETVHSGEAPGRGYTHVLIDDYQDAGDAPQGFPRQDGF